MKDQRRTDIKVGLIVLLGLILTIWIFVWAKNFYMYSDQKSVSILFPTAAGLELGDPVAINGVRKGFVDDILIQGNNAIVKISVESGVSLKEDARFAITMLDLMGGKKVEVKPGVSKRELDYGKTHIGDFYADVPEVMAMLGNVQGDLLNIIKQVQVTLSSVNGLLGDKNIVNDLRNSLSNLSLVAGKMNLMLDENRKDLRKIADNGAELTDETLKMISENRDNIKNTLTESEKAIVSTKNLLDKIDSMLSETKNGNNNLGKLMYDESLVGDLKVSLQQVKELTKILVDQLKNEGVNVDAKIKIF